MTDHGSTVTAGTFTVTPSICCARTAAPRSSFPVYAGGFTPHKLVTFYVPSNGSSVGNLAAAGADATGNVAIASARLPDTTMPGSYTVLAVQGDVAAQFALEIQASWGALSSTAR